MKYNIKVFKITNLNSLMKPSSFCTISTYNCSYELIGLLLSLSLYHRNETIYIMCDSKTKNEVDNMTPRPRLNIVFCVELDKYDGLNRMSMVQKGMNHSAFCLEASGPMNFSFSSMVWNLP